MTIGTDWGKFNSTYDNLERAWRSEKRFTIEPLENALLVERFRQYWKPETVNVVLLAESHVYPEVGDDGVRLPETYTANVKSGAFAETFSPQEDLRILRPDADYPSGFARFVYCLGHGENDVVKEGTPQYWKLLYACANQISAKDDFAPILKTKTTCPVQRIRNKIQLLEQLRHVGVWLVDTSIVALYKRDEDDDGIVNPIGMADYARLSWNGYTRGVVEACNPKMVVVIGTSVVQDTVEADLLRMGCRYKPISQPNAKGLSSDEQFAQYASLNPLARSVFA